MGLIRRSTAGRAAPRRRGWPVVAIAACTAILLMLSGIALDVERGLGVWRNGLHPRAASGRLALVEIDARSLRSLDRWPWPRGIFARSIAALDRAGARTIAFDVDFSSRSDAGADAALARAIAAAPVPVVLPTFRQAASQTSRVTIENLPIAPLRPNAMLAAVNIRADGDGLVRAYPYGITTSGAPRPSIGALLADAAGRSEDSFPIDGAIDPATIPRVSFVDLLRDPVRAAAVLRGRSVLIGATAIELGDRYPMPGRGVVPGPLIQLLAAETLIQHSAPVNHGAALPFVVLLLVCAAALRAGPRRRAIAFVTGLAAIFLLPLVTECLRLGTFAVVPALAGLAAAWVAAMVTGAIAAARDARLFDEESGLPNLRSLEARLADGAAGAVLVFRLGQASDVAAVSGHAGLGSLVAQVAARLGGATGRTLYRVEDSAVAWLLPGDDPDEHVADLDGAAALLRLPFMVADRSIDADGGFGIADAIGPGAVGRAAAAADRAIADGLRWARHSADREREQDWRLRIAGEIDAAMAAGDIHVAYQPKLDIATGAVHAAEALVRWRHPERGPIPPDAFIPALEESGHIADLTVHIVERVLADQAAWRMRGIALDIAVNVSARLPADAAFVARLEAILAAHPEGIAHLTLEVTESAAMIDPEAAAVALDRLAALGLKLSIDDYGTGQSTLSYLKRLPAREIKIDKSFVLALETSRGDQAMVRSTIDLAHELGFKVVAEGVETAAVLDLLRGFGCDTAQGWHIGRPGPAADLLALAATASGVRAAA